MNADSIIFQLQRSNGVIHMQLKGLSHEDTLLQLPFRGNCMNWTIGHIVAYRHVIMNLAKAETPWDDNDYANYKNGSDPITSDEQALRLERIVSDLEKSQEIIEAALNALTDEELAEVVDEKSGSTRAQRLVFMAWHECYHSGQTEILRQLAGTDDKVI
ncbi:MAG: DinB family protein [Chloroflexota bacterium]